MIVRRRAGTLALLVAAGLGTVDANDALAIPAGHRPRDTSTSATSTAISQRQGKRAGKPTPKARPRHAGKATIAKKAHPKSGKRSALLERHVPAIKGGLPNVQAMGALVLDENGRELYSRMPDRERPIASISKLAATLVVMDRGLELEGLSTITKADSDVARGGARSRLLEGMILSNRDLLHAALMGSDNRAIPALGRAVKLSPSQLAAAMTAKARELGLTKTRFHDPTGLSIENVSTPRETIVLLRAVIVHPVLGPITQRVEYNAHPIGKPPITYVNTYRPAMRNHVQVLGGKTGYNDDARYCLVLAAKIDGQTCFMSFLANEGKLTRFGDVARVADWLKTRKPKGRTPAPMNVGAPAPSSFAPTYAENTAPPTPSTDSAVPPRWEPTAEPPSPVVSATLPAAQPFPVTGNTPAAGTASGTTAPAAPAAP